MPKEPPRKICAPCDDNAHAGCDGPADCDCTTCAQLRDLEDTARDQVALMWPLEPPKQLY